MAKSKKQDLTPFLCISMEEFENEVRGKKCQMLRCDPILFDILPYFSYNSRLFRSLALILRQKNEDQRVEYYSTAQMRRAKKSSN
jgi:hypothetical protein